MTASVWTDLSDLSSVADSTLKLAARFWFVVVVIGQWMFGVYVVSFYGGTAIRGDLNSWNKVMAQAYTPGDTIRNLVVAVHLLLAVIVIVGGPLQLIPQIRRHAPAFHRWNGRLYIPTVIMTSIAGVYMVWSRERAGVVQLGTTLHAILIIGFAILAVRYAIARDITAHRQWALRLFMVLNAGWFFRFGLMRWIFLNQGPEGSFLNFFSLADYLLPLVILEIYLRTKDRAGVGGRFAMAGALSVLTVAMGIGIFSATLVMWLPRM